MVQEEEFENLTLDQKQNRLKDVIQEINKVNKDKLINGSFEISDITYYKLDNGKIFYEVEVTSKDENGKTYTSAELYEATKSDDSNLANDKSDDLSDNFVSKNSYKKVDIAHYDDELKNLEQNISDFNNLNYDTKNLELQKEMLENEKNEIEHLSSNQSKTSLSDLNKREQNIKYLATYYGIPEEQLESYLEINGDKNFAQIEQVKELANEMGIKDEDIANYTKTDKNGNVNLDAKKVNLGGIKSNEISGNEKLTTFYSLNDILGKNYESYVVIKSTNSKSCVIGITKDGNIEEIDNNTISLNNSKEMSLMDENGKIRNVGVMVSFSVRNTGSTNNGKELVGLYNDRGNVGAFYARRELDGVAIGKGIEKSQPKNVTNENMEKQILDYRRNNDISGEATSAYQRTYDGCTDDIKNLSSNSIDHNDLDSIVKQYCEIYGIDEDELKEATYENLEKSHQSEKSDEEIVKDSADEINNKFEEIHNDNDEHSDNDTNEHSEDDEFEHIHGTPWGNPNSD